VSGASISAYDRARTAGGLARALGALSFLVALAAASSQQHVAVYVPARSGLTWYIDAPEDPLPSALLRRVFDS
jgi:hypothetical protein